MCLANKQDCIDCLRAENIDLKGQVLNLMGKLEVTENTVPQFAIDMATLIHLELVHDARGTTATRIKTNCGS